MTGPPMTSCPSSALRSPIVTVALASGVNDGARLVTFTVPTVVFCSALRALRPARDVERVDVDVVRRARQRHDAVGHAVDGDAEARIDGGSARRGRDAANRDATRGGIAVVPADVAEPLEDVGDVQRRERLELLAADDRDRLRNVLLRFERRGGDAVRRDDEGFDVSRCGGRGRFLRLGGDAQRAGNRMPGTPTRNRATRE